MSVVEEIVLVNARMHDNRVAGPDPRRKRVVVIAANERRVVIRGVKTRERRFLFFADPSIRVHVVYGTLPGSRRFAAGHSRNQVADFLTATIGIPHAQAHFIGSTRLEIDNAAGE